MWKKDDCQKFIIATEEGILHEMKKRAPHKELIPALVFDESCNCSECFFMKRNTLRKVVFVHEIRIARDYYGRRTSFKSFKTNRSDAGVE